MTTLHLHPSEDLADLKVAMVYAEQGLFRLIATGHPEGLYAPAMQTIRRLVREIDRQIENDTLREATDSGRSSTGDAGQQG